MKPEVKLHFDGISQIYESSKKKLYLDLMKSMVQNQTGNRVLDLGCATGLALSWLNAEEKIGVDFSSNLLRKAHQGSYYLAADVENTPLQENYFDLILCLDVIEHLPSFTVLKEAFRLLKSTGVLLIAVADSRYEFLLDLLEKLKLKLPEGPHRWLKNTDIENAIELAGFQFRKIRKMHMNFYTCTKR